MESELNRREREITRVAESLVSLVEGSVGSQGRPGSQHFFILSAHFNKFCCLFCVAILLKNMKKIEKLETEKI